MPFCAFMWPVVMMIKALEFRCWRRHLQTLASCQMLATEALLASALSPAKGYSLLDEVSIIDQVVRYRLHPFYIE